MRSMVIEMLPSPGMSWMLKMALASTWPVLLLVIGLVKFAGIGVGRAPIPVRPEKVQPASVPVWVA